VEEALVLAWKTLNRICTKRLMPYLPSIVEALEAEEHLELNEEQRHLLLLSVAVIKWFFRLFGEAMHTITLPIRDLAELAPCKWIKVTF
jgi:hypothetical protein